jgi:hypothetical protein
MMIGCGNQLRNGVVLISLDPSNHQVPARLQKLARFPLPHLISIGAGAQLFSGSTR